MSTINKGQLLQDPFLNILRKEHIPVSIYLVNGIKLQGQVESFDQYVVLLRNTVTQMVYKHAISTVVPTRALYAFCYKQYSISHPFCQFQGWAARQQIMRPPLDRNGKMALNRSIYNNTPGEPHETS